VKWENVLKELERQLGPGQVQTGSSITAQYAVDEVKPRGVVFPRNTGEVSQVVKLARSAKLALVPWGSGSKMSMGNPPTRLDIVLCTSRMNHILDVDTANLTATVEAGVKFRDVQARLATQDDRCYLPLKTLASEGDGYICSDRSKSGCFLPLDPPFSKTATMGGIVAANSSGSRRLLYRLPRDLILGVRFVSAEGDIIGTGGKTVKNVSGYDISKLIIGSCGSLGILCETTFRLLPLPEKMETLLLSFGTFSDACAFVDAVMESTLLPAALDLLNTGALRNLSFKIGDDPGSRGYVVAVALEAFDQAVDRMRREMLEMAGSLGVENHRRIEEEDHRLFWLAVSELIPSLAGRFPGLISLKLNYPISHGKNIVTFAGQLLSERGLENTIVAHGGSGLCSINLLMDEAGHREMDKVLHVINQLRSRCIEGGGNLVVERARTALKPSLNVWGNLEQDFPIMNQIKQTLDPAGTLSPGRYVGGL